MSHLVLRDETVGLHGLLPLEEDHVIEWGEGQGLRSDAARNYSRREKQPSLKQTLHSSLKLMDSCAGMPGCQGVKTPLTKQEGTERNGGGQKKREQRDRAEGR